MLAVSTQTKGRNLKPYNRFESTGIAVLIANDVMDLGEEVLITVKGTLVKKLQADVHKLAAYPLK